MPHNEVETSANGKKTSAGVFKTITNGILELATGLMGCAFVAIGLFVVVGLVKGCYDVVRPTVDVKVSGRLDPGIINDDELELFLWHQHPGTLKNGRIDVTLTGKQVKSSYGGEYRTITHSFDSWAPNKSGQIPFTFALKGTSDLDLTVRVQVTAEGVQNFSQEHHWKGNDWK